MDGPELKACISAGLSRERIEQLGRELGVVQRESVIFLFQLVLATVLSPRTHSGGRQADAMRDYLALLGLTSMSRSTFYGRFTAPFSKLLETLLQDALLTTGMDPVLLPPLLQGVKDWLIVDSTTVQLHDALQSKYPGTTGAALKVHKLFSLGRQNLMGYTLSPARFHDSQYLTFSEEVRGYGFLLDLGYASYARFLDAERLDIKLVMKLKTGWKVALDGVYAGEQVLDPKELKGKDFWLSLEAGHLKLEKGLADVDGWLESIDGRVKVRVVVVEVEGKGRCVFLTNLPREHYSAQTVGDLYRMRWDIERDNKLNKSDTALDQLDGTKVASVEAMVYASLLGSMLVNRVVHRDHLNLAARKEPLTRGPMHPRLVAMCLLSWSRRAGEALLGEEAQWDWLAAGLVGGQATDPNWRRRPSVLDTHLGFTGKSTPRPKKSKSKIGAA